MQADKFYSYTMSKGRILFVLITVAAMSVFSLYKAMTNTQPLLIHHLIPLDARQATAFFWILGVFMTSVTLWFVYAMAVSAGGPKEIRLTSASLDMPMKGKTLSIPYSQISGTAMEKIGKQRRLMIQYSGGKTAISSILFANQEDFESCVVEIRRHVAARKAT